MNPIFIFNKKSSPRRIEIHVAYDLDPDGWFIEIRWIRKKTDKLDRKSVILSKELDDWIASFKESGWIREN